MPGQVQRTVVLVTLLLQGQSLGARSSFNFLQVGEKAAAAKKEG